MFKDRLVTSFTRKPTSGTPEEGLGSPHNSIDFQKKPRSIERWNFPEPITRENFINFLILTFAVSRGVRNAQGMFCKYTEVRTGSPVFDIFESLVSVGGWNRLTPEEQQTFLRAFHGRTKHDCIWEQQDMKGIAKEFELLPHLKGSIENDINFYKITSFDDQTLWPAINRMIKDKPHVSNSRVVLQHGEKAFQRI
jgi:hypothetical protein